jgi:hypothetical protein
VFELIGAGRQCSLELFNLCVRAKTNAGMGSLYRSQHELVCVFKTGALQHTNNVELGRHGRNRSNLWTNGADAQSAASSLLSRIVETAKQLKHLRQTVTCTRFAGPII